MKKMVVFLSLLVAIFTLISCVEPEVVKKTVYRNDSQANVDPTPTTGNGTNLTVTPSPTGSTGNPTITGVNPTGTITNPTPTGSGEPLDGLVIYEDGSLPQYFTLVAESAAGSTLVSKPTYSGEHAKSGQALELTINPVKEAGLPLHIWASGVGFIGSPRDVSQYTTLSFDIKSLSGKGGVNIQFFKDDKNFKMFDTMTYVTSTYKTVNLTLPGGDLNSFKLIAIYFQIAPADGDSKLWKAGGLEDKIYIDNIRIHGGTGPDFNGLIPVADTDLKIYSNGFDKTCTLKDFNDPNFKIKLLANKSYTGEHAQGGSGTAIEGSLTIDGTSAVGAELQFWAGNIGFNTSGSTPSGAAFDITGKTKLRVDLKSLSGIGSVKVLVGNNTGAVVKALNPVGSIIPNVYPGSSYQTIEFDLAASGFTDSSVKLITVICDVAPNGGSPTQWMLSSEDDKIYIDNIRFCN